MVVTLAENVGQWMESQLKVSPPPMPSVPFLFTLICLLNALDVVISLQVVTTVCRELNPIIASLMCHFGRLPAFLGPKVLFLSLLAIGIFSTRFHSLFTRRMLIFIATVYGFLVSYLFGVLLAQ